LVAIRKVWSERDARRLQRVLDVAGIPFYMGKEEATGVDDVTSNFAEGVPVGVMQIGVPGHRRQYAKTIFRRTSLLRRLKTIATISRSTVLNAIRRKWHSSSWSMNRQKVGTVPRRSFSGHAVRAAMNGKMTAR
jgi:hypothetical protein